MPRDGTSHLTAPDGTVHVKVIVSPGQVGGAGGRVTVPETGMWELDHNLS